MKKGILLIFFILSLNHAITFAQDSKKLNSAGIGVAIIPAFPEGIYLGQPWDFHPNRELSYFLQLNYHRALVPSFKIGTFVDYERIRFTVEENDTIRSFRRYNLGADFLYAFPEKAFHVEMGGFLGWGMLKANLWNNLYGFDYGFIAGPVWESDNIGLSAQFRMGYALYSSDGIPAEVRLYTPKILLRFYFTL